MNSKIVSGLLLALCGIGIWQTTIIPESTMYSEVGPILAPSVVIAALTTLVQPTQKITMLPINRPTSNYI